ncbi:heat shock 70 kDa protein BIP2-like [Miscanthus floridulus]|uniref:heat shock 70 kDa protein BIP2-like n=1 Tax=Miscanthus floridulus TaxID=154761 RepID=UPI00345747FF
MLRKDVALVVRAFIWLLALVTALGKAGALLDHDWPPDKATYPPGRVVAIDLGNTNSCVAGYENGETAQAMFHHCISSWVAFADDGAVLVGEDAMNHAAVNPGAAISGFKRLLGKRFTRVFEREFAQSVKDNLPYKVVEKNAQLHVEVKTKDGAIRNVGVDQLTATVLAKLKETAEAHLGHRVEAAILTLLLEFFDYASRSAAVFAGRLAGLKAVRAVLSEPVAAAIAYGLSRNLRDEGNVVVLHVGGGIAEASVMTFVDGVYEALSTQYDPFFGGQDFDRRIVDHFVQLVRGKHGKDIAADGAALDKLRTACEHAKKTLSHQEHAQVSIESLIDGVDLSELLTRAEFEELNHDLFLKVVEMVNRVVTEAEVDTVDEVLLVGGSTVIPKVRELMSTCSVSNRPYS